MTKTLIKSGRVTECQVNDKKSIKPCAGTVTKTAF